MTFWNEEELILGQTMGVLHTQDEFECMFECSVLEKCIAARYSDGKFMYSFISLL